MKILHVPYTFFPDPSGGTEVYVESLAHELQQVGVSSVIAAPSAETQSYTHRNLQIHRYAVNVPKDLRELHGAGDTSAAIAFSEILAAENPDLVHMHAFTHGASLRCVQAAKSRGIPVVFTYHTPTVSCQRGTMMQWGSTVCSGEMNVHTCTACTLHSHLSRRSYSKAQLKLVGVWARPVAQAISGLPPSFGAGIGRLNLQGGLWTALRMSEMLELRHSTVLRMFTEVDHIVAVCAWVKQVLIRNGAANEKITLCRQGIAESSEIRTRRNNGGHSALRCAFLGRLDPTKGLDIVLTALRSIPQAILTLDIYGIAQGTGASEYQQSLLASCEDDNRIHFHAPIAPEKVTSTLRGYDLLIVPSQWLETGPLVVLEAFAAGVPVLGSRLGGIAELVQDGINGVLVEPLAVDQWAKQLQILSQDRAIIRRLSEGTSPPRTMKTVAAEMASLYKHVVSERVPSFPSTHHSSARHSAQV